MTHHDWRQAALLGAGVLLFVAGVGAWWHGLPVPGAALAWAGALLTLAAEGANR